jgi:hypothetical protein
MNQCLSPIERQNVVSQNVWDITNILCLRMCLDYSRNKTDVLYCNVYLGGKIKTNEMGGYVAHMRRGDVNIGFRLVNLNERSHLEAEPAFGGGKWGDRQMPRASGLRSSL